MNHNTIQPKMFDPKHHTKRQFNHAGFCWALSGLMFAFMVMGSLLGWFDAAQAAPVLTELPATGK